MPLLKNYIGNLYLPFRVYVLLAIASVLFLLSFFFPVLFEPAIIYIALVTAAFTCDYILLFFSGKSITVSREMAQRFSLGDDNKVLLRAYNNFPFKVKLKLIDELPEQFQERKFELDISIAPRKKSSIPYNVKPTTRGEYEFGNVICYVSSPLQLVQRRMDTARPEMVKIYPSFLQLKKYQLLALSDNIQYGVKKIRRIGHSMEFEKIKNYVQGDDVRTINWKATARSSGLMVNMYTDLRQQQVYCLLDKGRAMKMPFDNMSLLDYSINASLALSNIALLRQDRAGLITFSNTVNDIVAADRRSGQLNNLLETLYKQQTDFKESDYENLWHIIHRRITHRSCLLLFTNFETFAALERQLPYLKRLAARHLLCVIFFQNTLLKQIQDTQPDTIEGIYIKTIADRFDYEKRQIVKELQRHGIISILTTPQQLTVDVINKYLELKARQLA